MVMVALVVAAILVDQAVDIVSLTPWAVVVADRHTIIQHTYPIPF